MKPLVLHGDQGLSRKGPKPGQASHYYSLTRLQTEGTVTVAGRQFAVTGLSWLDRNGAPYVLAAPRADSPSAGSDP